MDGGERTISEEQLTALDVELRGDVLLPESDGYDAACTLWNAMIVRRPALVARCAGAADVIRAVRFAADNELLLAVRGAGHNIAGKGVCDGGFLIDLSGLRSVHVDPERRVATVDPGATLGDIDDETQLYGLAVPTGINSTTGIAGLTLGGGFGWLSRKHGLTVDNLRSARVVTASGELLTASEDENADLFWGLRGGGGNFGVATSFEFDLCEVGPEVLSGLIVHPLSAAPELTREYREFARDLPADLNVWLVLRKAPPMPFLPPEVHGTEVAILAAFYSGELSEGERLLQPLRDYGDPIADVISPHTFIQWQTAFDPLLTPGARNYWKSHNFLELSDGLLDTALDYTQRLPSDQTEIFFGRLGGAVNERASDATAYPHRDAEYVMNVHARWEDPADDDACIHWARSYFNDTEKYATGGVYVNFVPDGEAPTDAEYGPNYERLVALKRKYDPQNLFRVNQNIAP
ncbi:MAG: FAD-binding oxidoreductase [Myxococcales bacterium]|nr:MAG: FAD-binding oxidoreductase [Myxococcales bacterium]